MRDSRLPSLTLFAALATTRVYGGPIASEAAPVVVASVDRLDSEGMGVISTTGDASLNEAADARMRQGLLYAAIAIEAFYDTNGGSYTGATLKILRRLGFRPASDVTVNILDATDQHYRLEASARGGSFGSWVFDSNDAKMKPRGP
jgi:hypothetical protein